MECFLGIVLSIKCHLPYFVHLISVVRVARDLFCNITVVAQKSDVTQASKEEHVRERL